MTALPFAKRRALALSILSDGGNALTKKAGQFLGQIAVDEADLTPRQLEWLGQLAGRVGLVVEG